MERKTTGKKKQTFKIRDTNNMRSHRLCLQGLRSAGGGDKEVRTLSFIVVNSGSDTKILTKSK